MITKDKLVEIFLNTADAPMFIKDTEGKLLWVNRAFADVFQAPIDQIIGKSDYDFCSKELADKYRKNDLKVIEQGRAIDFIEDVQLSDGVHKFVSHKFPISNIEGLSDAIASISTEIALSTLSH